MVEMTTTDPLIVALDMPDAHSALALASRLESRVRWFKVGLELYLAAGDRVVRQLKDRGCSVFLDLKLHDIPNTVAGAIRSISRMEPDLLTLHASGGRAMMTAARDAAASLTRPPRLLAVTVLTSLDGASLDDIGVCATPAEQVLRLGRLATECGMAGMVCSPQEAGALRAALPEALLVTPGIRPAGTEGDDQKRIATPASALSGGADMLVVGRPITAASDPRAAVDAILEEIRTAESRSTFIAST